LSCDWGTLHAVLWAKKKSAPSVLAAFALLGILLVVTVVVYPVGLEADVVRNEACGLDAARYNLADCKLMWGFWLTACCAVLALLLSFLTLCVRPPADKYQVKDRSPNTV
jgi:hypothetical protein